jgi:hypothetical protein
MSELSGHSDDIETILDKIRRNSIQLNYAHKQKYEKLKNKLVYFRLPTICLSAINSVFSVGLSAYMKQQDVSVINCLISLVCGIIVSVELYLQIEKAMSIEYDVSKSYYLLGIEIQRFLLTKRENRTIDCQPFLDKSYNQYTKLFENSRLLKKSIHDNLTDLEREDKIAGITITPSQSAVANSVRLNNQTDAITESRVYNSDF